MRSARIAILVNFILRNLADGIALTYINPDLPLPAHTLRASEKSLMTAIGSSSIPAEEVTFLPMSRITESHAIPAHLLPVIASPECLDGEIATDREIELVPLSSDVARKTKTR